MTPSELARILRAAADEADRIEAEQRADRREWHQQAGSPLGNRRHCAAVRRRVDAGAEGAAIVGRRHLLSPTALEEELEALTRRPKTLRRTEPETTGSRLRARLGLASGGRS